jgi:hypothetical protein
MWSTKKKMRMAKAEKFANQQKSNQKGRSFSGFALPMITHRAGNNIRVSRT